eukprot:scaffold134851_cov17-Tisochrysis_lutea.AAC.1
MPVVFVLCEALQIRTKSGSCNYSFLAPQFSGTKRPGARLPPVPWQACNCCARRLILPYAGSELVRKSIQAMIEGKCEEVALEAEVTNQGALKLYQGLGFIRDKRLHRNKSQLRQPDTQGCLGEEFRQGMRCRRQLLAG